MSGKLADRQELRNVPKPCGMWVILSQSSSDEQEQAIRDTWTQGSTSGRDEDDTPEILADDEAMKRLAQAQADIDAGRLTDWDEYRKKR